jgi:hypothetical protein
MPSPRWMLAAPSYPIVAASMPPPSCVATSREIMPHRRLILWPGPLRPRPRSEVLAPPTLPKDRDGMPELHRIDVLRGRANLRVSAAGAPIAEVPSRPRQKFDTRTRRDAVEVLVSSAARSALVAPEFTARVPRFAPCERLEHALSKVTSGPSAHRSKPGRPADIWGTLPVLDDSGLVLASVPPGRGGIPS